MTEASVHGRVPEGGIPSSRIGTTGPATALDGPAAPAASSGSGGRFLWMIPVAAAVLAYSGTLSPEFTAAAHRPSDEDIGGLTLEAVVLQNPWYQSIRSYSPLTLASYALSKSLGADAWAFHLTNVLLHAAASLLAYLLLREILGRGWLATLGGALFAVLPIQSDAVASVWARADIIAGVALLGSWLLALRNSPVDRSRGESPGLAFASSLAFLMGLFAREGVAIALPLVFASCWLLGRRFPWLTLASTASAALAFLVIRQIALADTMGTVDFVQNPLVSADFFTRGLNSISLFALYAAKVVLPVHLSFNYGYDELKVLSLGNPLLWILVLAVVASAVLCVGELRRRAPVIALAVLFFLLALVPYVNLVYCVAAMFSERYAYAASLAYPLALCGVLQAFGSRARTVPAGGESAPGGPSSPAAGTAWSGPALWLLCLFVLLYGARTFARNTAWAVPTSRRVELECPRSAMAHLKSGEFSLAEWATATSPDEKPKLLEKAWLHINKALEIYPGYGQAELIAAKLLFNEAKELPPESKYARERHEKYEQAVARFTAAREKLLAQTPPLSFPVLNRLRGEAHLLLGNPEKAFEDFDAYIKSREAAQIPAEAVTYNFRGLAAAQLGRLQDGLSDFNVALSYREDIPEYWNNRGFCRFQLKDYRGALIDYAKGLDLCEKKGILTSRQGESVFTFLARICDVYQVMEKVERTAGNEAAARAASEDFQRARARMQQIIQSQEEAVVPPQEKK